MKHATTLFTILLSTSVFAATDWSNPPAACVEEIVPNIPNEPCLDLTQVNDPLKDFPTGMSDADIVAWKNKKRTLQYCRYAEITRRETLNPGSQSANVLKLAWMLRSAIDGRDSKIQAIYKSSRDLKMPAHVLAGALRQESLFANIGIAPDGDNYSCGVGQINLTEWCNWISNQPTSVKTMLGWPTSVKCTDLQRTYVKPFYDIAITNLGDTPIYQLSWNHFENITLKEVQSGLGTGSASLINLRYGATSSFIQHCIDPLYGIQAKAYELARLYKAHIPKGMKEVQQYTSSSPAPTHKCQENSNQQYYPFHIGWVFAVGMYNAGPGILNALTHYWGWQKADLEKASTFSNITPLELVEGLYWAGVWDNKTDEVVYSKISGGESRSRWFKMCVVQRHVARVVQHATIEGISPLVETLEGTNPCKAATVDPVTGALITSAPLVRQQSSGKK
jgi:hypothetical protein